MKKQRILALFLVVAMMFTFASFNVIAEDEETQPEQTETTEETPAPEATVAPEATAAPEATEKPASKYTLEINFLKSVGVIEEAFDPETNITKAGMCELIAKILYPDIDFGSTTPTVDLFNDVKIDHEKYGYIKACKDLKIVSGDLTNNFNPDKELSGIDTITILINALGYKPFADAKGGYPTGYFTVAKETNIVKGVDYKADATVNSASAAKMIYNAMFADYVTISSVTGNEIEIQVNKGKNILSERLGITESDALVIDNGMTSLIGASATDENRVILQNVKDGKEQIAYAENSNIGDYLGYRVKAFIKNNETTGRNELVYFEVYKNAKSTEIISSKITSATSSYIEYEIDEDGYNFSKIKLDQQNPPLIMVNGYPKLNAVIDVDCKPADGILTVIDNDGNGVCEIINILNFNIKDGVNVPYARNIVVDSVDAEEGYIFCKFNPQGNIELSKDKNVKYLIKGNEEIKTLADIQENDIVSIGEAITGDPSEKVYTLFVTRSTIEGTVSSKNSANNEVIINDKSYKVSSSVTSVKSNFVDNLSSTETMTFLVDATGKIAYVVNAKVQTKDYAYIIGATKGSFEQDLPKVKFVDKTGQIRLCDVSSKAKVDGKTFANGDALIALLKTRPAGSTASAGTEIKRPAIIKVNASNLITSIDTDTPNYATTTNETDYTDYTFIGYSQDEIDNNETLKAGYRSARMVEYRPANKSFDAKVAITDDTVILGVPDIDIYGLDKTNDFNKYVNKVDNKIVKLYELADEDANYKLMTTKDINYKMHYDLQGYDVDPDTGVAAFAVVRGRNDVYQYGAAPYDNKNPMCVFLETRDSYDEATDKKVTTIVYNKGGNEETAKVDLDTCVPYYRMLIQGATAAENPHNSKEVNKLKKGDIIRVIKVGDNLTHLERVAELGRYNEMPGADLYPTVHRQAYIATLSTNSGFGGGNIPLDVRGLKAGYSQTYTLNHGIIKQLKGNTAKYYVGCTTNDKIVLGDQTTYDIQAVPLPASVLEIIVKSNGNIQVKQSGLECIKTSEEVGFAKASRVTLKHTDYKIDQVIIVNYE